LLDFDTAIVWREDQVNFTAKTIYSSNPIKCSVHALFQTIFGIFLELEMHLIQDMF